MIKQNECVVSRTAAGARKWLIVSRVCGSWSIVRGKLRSRFRLFVVGTCAGLGPHHGAAAGPVSRLRASVAPKPKHQCACSQPDSIRVLHRPFSQLQLGRDGTASNININSSSSNSNSSTSGDTHQQRQRAKKMSGVVGGVALREQLGSSRSSAQRATPAAAAATRNVPAAQRRRPSVERRRGHR